MGERSRQRMRQILQYQDGRLEIQDVPMPTAPPGGVLVRTTHSVVSIGTERMKVEQARMNLLKKAQARPDQVRKVLDTARNLGWRAALEKVRNRLETPTPLGYSSAGVVVGVDARNTRFRVGDRVACAGAECSFHAEYVAVPDMLAASIPVQVPNWQAAYTTVCAIALHAVRQAEPQLGDRILVIGQGLVGLLVTNLLSLGGARVMATDVQASRVSIARAMGAEKVVIVSGQDLADEVRLWTQGYGVDVALVCTASQANGPVEQAAQALRDRGRLVAVGINRMDLPFNVFYGKELDVRFSRSYGPGRYDPSYEWGGTDYPIGYVRWTEQRNFDACLQLMAEGKLNLGGLTTRRVKFSEALEVYDDLARGGGADVGVILEYSNESDDREHAVAACPLSVRRSVAPLRPLTMPVQRLDVIGAGTFARTMLLPHLKGRVSFGTVVNRTALSAAHVRAKFGFQNASTDPTAVLSDNEPTAVLIATRHDLHASLVKEALATNRHVFVEKPLCLSREELQDVDIAMAKSQGSLQVGFNRRFAPASAELKRRLAAVPGPKTATYRVLPGLLAPNDWYANYAESGGRVVGEACHFLDYFCFLFDAQPIRVLAQVTSPAGGRLPFPDSVAAQVEFDDGSCGQLLYNGEGDSAYPKETLTVVAPGLVAEVTNFRQLDVYSRRKRKRYSYSSKGHGEQMFAWSQFLLGGAEHPLPYEQSRTSMLLTFAVLESIQRGHSVGLDGNA
jgi:predicted dehydrogenase/threonine dehydrogenase-like Zn-dependent dehydrogenase